MTKPHVSVETAIASYPASWDMGFHRHPEYEISAVLDGQGWFEFDGTAFALERGHIVAVPPGLSHRFAAASSIRFAVLAVGNLDRNRQEFFYRLTPQSAPKLFFLSSLDMDIYESLFRNWLKMISVPLTEQNQVTHTWFELFLVFIQQHTVTSEQSPVSIVNASEYIRNELHAVLNISELAKKFGFSVSNFRKLFTASIGMSPKQYQQQCRLQETQWLLRSTDKPILEISRQVGFTSIHQFSTWFHKLIGIPPTQWRKMQRGEGSSEGL